MLIEPRLFMYAYYSKHQAEPEVNQPFTPLEGVHSSIRHSCLAKRVLSISNSFALLILTISAIILHYFPSFSQTWANILGTSLAVGACIQWLPQVVTTWNLGHLGSLSPTSLCFLAPYNWVFGISMIARLGPGGWSAWIVYVLVGTMQAVLIGFAMAFWLRERKAQRESAIFEVLLGTEPSESDEQEKHLSEHPKASEIGETSPLLGDDR